MRRQWFGDPFDIVKRFFIEVLRDLGYRVYIDPMFTGDWREEGPAFWKFLGVTPVEDRKEADQPAALFFDPNTGVGRRTSCDHITTGDLLRALKTHEVSLAFDQSFTRSRDAKEQMLAKLRRIEGGGAHGFYFDSHARFLFTSQSKERLADLRSQLERIGLPPRRFVQSDGAPAT